MSTYILEILFFSFSIIYLFLGMKKFNIARTQYFLELYFCIMILLSILSFFYGLFYFLDKNSMTDFIYQLEFFIYSFIFPLILNALIYMLDDKDKKLKPIIYIFPLLLIAIFMLNFGLNRYFNSNILNYIFITYIILFMLASILAVYNKMKILSSKKYKDKLKLFSLIYTFSCISFIYISSQNNINTIYFISNKSLGVLIFLFPMIVLHSITNELFFDNIMPDSVIRNIIDSMNESIILTDKNDDIIYFNKKASELMSKSETNIRDIIDYNRIPIDFLEENKSIEVYLKSQCQTETSVMLYTSIYDKFDEIRARIYIFQNIKELIDIRQKLRKVKKGLEDKIAKRTQELEEYNKKLQSEIENRVSIEYQIRDIFCYDTLTGLYNRMYFIQNLEMVIVEESDKKHALMFLDLDGFKAINDSLGHSYGDDVLIDISNRIRQLYKYKNVIISRFGGDEFVILFKDVPNEEFVTSNAKDILETIKEPIYFDNARVYVSASIGIAMYPKDGNNTEDLTKNADTAMYKSKENGKNQYHFFEEEFRQDIQREYDLTHNLVNSIDRNELLLYYQPQISIIDGKAQITGLESLMRWKKNGKLLSPNVFIPVAEKSNMITEMGKWAITKACEQCVKWKQKYGKDFRVAINLSSNQLMNPMLYDEVSAALIQTGVNPSYIELEITETSIVKNIKQSIVKLSLLKELGVRISVDDFGTKYATFNYLKQLPVDKIKIDISFIKGIGENKIDEAIMLSLISLSKELNVDIIAEGVETKEELDFLVKNGCNSIQGFYFFKPMSVEDIDDENILDYECDYDEFD